MLRVAGGLLQDKQLGSGRKHGEIAGNLSLYCAPLSGSMPGMENQKMQAGNRGVSNFEQVGSEDAIDSPAKKDLTL
jgi:hypothetical protein